MTRKAVVICPGRGTYNKAELGYIARHHGDKCALLAEFDAARRAAGQKPLAELDGAARFSTAEHTSGDNASPLIFAASYMDALSIDDGYEIVAVTGNSMGWYIGLGVAGGADPLGAFEIVNTMGRLMHESMIGGQSLYPFVDENWQEIPGLRRKLLELVALIDARDGHDLAVSIHLGGMLVVAGNAAGLEAFEADLPRVQSRYPMRLPGHAAFHTPLQSPVAAKGRGLLGEALFKPPTVPLIDGRGALWYPQACDAASLRDYTLGHQVVAPYDFTAAIRVAARTFAPDVFILTGPGDTLGGAVAQSLIAINWQGLDSKAAFQARQKADPVLLSMGREEDRRRVTRAGS